MIKVFISLGSNIEPEKNIYHALERLHPILNIEKVSTFYWTRPIEREGQSNFLNGVLSARSSLTPLAIKFDLLREIESLMGRKRGLDKHAARIIDLDLILYGDLLIQDKDLTLPDPEILDRPFLHWPLLEIVPEITLPGDSMKLQERIQGPIPKTMVKATEFSRRVQGLLNTV
jgi:2-amino-4-hydroxy-6-hydroxymethyldihydropteridine diphosphokinase